jgi:hypothetical protein
MEHVKELDQFFEMRLWVCQFNIQYFHMARPANDTEQRQAAIVSQGVENIQQKALRMLNELTFPNKLGDKTDFPSRSDWDS